MNVNLEITDLATTLELREDENSWDIITTAFAFRPLPIQYLFLNPEWYGWTDSKTLRELSDKILYANSLEEAQSYKDNFHEAFWDYLPIIKPGNKSEIIAMRKNIDGLQYITGPIVWNITKDE